MKNKLNYKSKKNIIISVIVIALILISAIAVGLFLKGNNDAEATGNNKVENTVQNNAGENTPTGNVPENAENNGENITDNKTQENTPNIDNNENQENINGVNNNKNNTNNNQGNTNVTIQEFVTERVETIPEKVIAESYLVSWKPTKFETLISGNISFEKANIEAKKTVAKLTEQGVEENPESVKVGEILKYTITLTNTSKRVNGIVNVIDVIPAGTEFVSANKSELITNTKNYTSLSEVRKLVWENVKVKAGSEEKIVVYVRVVAKEENIDTTVVQNIATIYDGITPKEDVPSPETKVANITAQKTSTIIYNEEKPHEHIVVDGIHPLHEQDIIEYTIKLTNVGKGEGTVTVSDTVPGGTTLIKDGVVTVVDKNGTSTYQISELVSGIDVTVAPATENAFGIATVIFRVVVNSFDENTKTIRNDMAKVDEEETNKTEDEAEKVYIDITVEKVWKNLENDAAKVYAVETIKFQVKNENEVVDSVELTKNNLTHTFKDLPKYDKDGKEINYTVVELAVNDKEQEILDKYYTKETKYETNLTSKTATITNTFDLSKVTETVDIPVSKVWKNTESDAAKAYEITSLKLQVSGNGKVAEKVVTEKENWAHIFKNLPKYDENGNLIRYTILETAVNVEEQQKLEKYTQNIDQETGVITNTFDLNKVTETVDITITKVWEDNSNRYGTRPSSIVLSLNGTNYELSEFNDEEITTPNDEWTLTVKNLPKYDAQGNEIEYTVKENNTPQGYTKLENGLVVTNIANVIVEKTVNKANEDGSIGNKPEENDKFKAGDIIYYTLTFKNAGNTVIESKTLTDTISLKLELLEIGSITQLIETGTGGASPSTGTDDYGYTWTVTKNENGNAVVSWNLTDVEPGGLRELIIKTRISGEVEYQEIHQKIGVETAHQATLYVRKDGKVPYIGSGLSDTASDYTSSLGTVYLHSDNITYNAEANLISDDIFYALKNNHNIVDMVSKGITRTELKSALQQNGIILASDEIVLWYTIKNENNEHKIYGVIRKITDSELSQITNAVYMDQVKHDETKIDLEELIIAQTGTVTINVKSETTESVSTPMDVVLVLDVSGSMDGSNANHMVSAVNSSISTIMEENPDTRIGIVTFSDRNNIETLVPLAKYSTTSNFLAYTSGGMYSNSKITERVTGKSNSVYTTGGTYTQGGIKAGAQMLTSQTVTTFQATTQSGNQVSGIRTPVLILITDGDPTYYNDQADLSGSNRGNGSDTSAQHCYWTIRTAKHYKDAVTAKYYGSTQQNEAKFFTIGIGMEGELATTTLNPNQTNVDELKYETDRWGNKQNASSNSEEMKLYNLLNTNGTPYAYDYANGSKTGALTENDLETFITTSLEASSGITVVRAITDEETTNRRIDLTHIDTTQEFRLEIIGSTTQTYNSLQAAMNANYVKQDSLTGGYYVDLTSITTDATVNINYWHMHT